MNTGPSPGSTGAICKSGRPHSSALLFGRNKFGNSIDVGGRIRLVNDALSEPAFDSTIDGLACCSDFSSVPWSLVS